MARLAIGHPDFVYRPISDEHREKLRAAHRARLNIPQGYVRIYGVFVPEYHAEPLRSYAAWVRQNKGWDQAKSFVQAAGKRKWLSEKPSFTHPSGHFKLLGTYVPDDKRDLIAPYIEQMVNRVTYGREVARAWLRDAKESGWTAPMPALVKKSAAAGGKKNTIDWNLVEVLLEEGATREEVAAFLGTSLPYFRNKMLHRNREGASAYGSGARRYARKSS